MTQIGSDRDWSTIAAANCSSFALKNDGSLWGWGYSMGRAGDPLSPLRLDPGRFVAISASDFILLALRVDGTLWVGGPNAPVAAYAYVKAAAPNMVQVGKDTDWSEIYAGTQCFFARKKDSSWWFSGKMQHGSSLPTPRRLPMSSDPLSFAPRLGDALFLTRDGAIWLLTVEPDTGTFATALKKLKALLNRASAFFLGRPKVFDLKDFPIRPRFEKIWTLPPERLREEDNPSK